RIPPLKERPEDIPILAEHFIQLLRKRTARPISEISPEAVAQLCAYPFPGNVRELENAIEHGFVMCHGDCIDAHHLPPHIIEWKASHASNPVGVRDERAIIEEALRRNLGNRSRVARELGIHRSTLWRKMKGLGMSN
ncbi:MAG: helix-turn-helix domain-containing protein, partial [Acidobacteriota bacterium]